MTTPSFTISTIKPCADYSGNTYEGIIQNGCDGTLMKKNLACIADSYIVIGQGKIVHAKISDCEFYFYNEGKFILTKASCQENAINLLNKIFGGINE